MIYERNLHISVINTVTYTPALFVWTTPTEKERRKKSIRYCVYFHAQAVPPFTSMVAAYILLQFPKQWMHKTSTRFGLRQTAVALDDRGAWGVMAFDSRFAEAYNAARDLTASRPDRRSSNGDYAMTTWPESKENLHMLNDRMADQVIGVGR